MFDKLGDWILGDQQIEICPDFNNCLIAMPSRKSYLYNKICKHTHVYIF